MLLDEVVAKADSTSNAAKNLSLNPPFQKLIRVWREVASPSEATAPATVKVPYSLDDYVVADIEQDSWVEIQIKKNTVERGRGGMLFWKPE